MARGDVLLTHAASCAVCLCLAGSGQKRVLAHTLFWCPPMKISLLPLLLLLPLTLLLPLLRQVLAARSRGVRVFGFTCAKMPQTARTVAVHSVSLQRSICSSSHPP
eukprot:SAG11_NODE_20728_length_439_cov_1.138235_1_plen_105_part_10